MIVATIAGALFCACGLAGLGYGLSNLWQGASSPKWPTITGQIVTADLQRSRDGQGMVTYRAEIAKNTKWRATPTHPTASSSVTASRSVGNSIGQVVRPYAHEVWAGIDLELYRCSFTSALTCRLGDTVPAVHHRSGCREDDWVGQICCGDELQMRQQGARIFARAQPGFMQFAEGAERDHLSR